MDLSNVQTFRIGRYGDYFIIALKKIQKQTKTKMKNQEKNTTAKTGTLFLGIAVAMIVLLASPKVNAQESKDSLHRKAQVTFFYPVGSNGQSSDYTHNYSLNILYGSNAGLNGVELAGFTNVNKGHVKGAQLAGLSNHTDGDVSGLQMAGMINGNKGQMSGVQISGIANYNSESTQGVQVSTVNIVKTQAEGMQIGVVNYAKKMKGTSFGVVNIVGDSSDVLPIGLINVVKNGYYELEVTGGLAIHANVNFKMGVEKFYTILKTGYSSYENDPVYTYGLGIGTLINFSEKHRMSVDLSTNGIVYDNDWNVWDTKNILNKLDITFRNQFSSKFSLLIGPSLNHYISEVQVGNSFGTLRSSGNISEKKTDDKVKSMWIGLNAGIAFKL